MQLNLTEKVVTHIRKETTPFPLQPSSRQAITCAAQCGMIEAQAVSRTMVSVCARMQIVPKLIEEIASAQAQDRRMHEYVDVNHGLRIGSDG